MTTFTIVLLLTVSENEAAYGYSNGCAGQPVSSGVVRALDPSPCLSVVPISSDSPTLSSTMALAITTPNTPPPSDCARSSEPLYPAPLTTPVLLPTRTTLLASSPLSDTLLDSRSKYTNVLAGSTGWSPAPAPPPNTLTLMLRTHDALETVTGWTLTFEKKAYSPKFTFNRKYTSCVLTTPFLSVSRLLSCAGSTARLGALGFDASVFR